MVCLCAFLQGVQQLWGSSYKCRYYLYLLALLLEVRAAHPQPRRQHGLLWLHGSTPKPHQTVQLAGGDDMGHNSTTLKY